MDSDEIRRRNRLAVKKYRESHIEQRLEYGKLYRDANRDITRAASRNWQKNNLWRARAHANKRHATKLRACPAWVDTAILLSIYQRCPVGYEVDHEIPLVHPDVCGLHVPCNLQYLTREENRRKRNTFPYVSVTTISTKVDYTKKVELKHCHLIR